MDATSVEIHQLKPGLTDAEIDDGYLSSGSLAGMSDRKLKHVEL